MKQVNFLQIMSIKIMIANNGSGKKRRCKNIKRFILFQVLSFSKFYPFFPRFSPFSTLFPPFSHFIPSLHFIFFFPILLLFRVLSISCILSFFPILLLSAFYPFSLFGTGILNPNPSFIPTQ